MSWKKARKRPVIIEYREVVVQDNLGYEIINTREGTLMAYPNQDFIIRGIEGELYPIKKKIFYKTYEVVDGG